MNASPEYRLPASNLESSVWAFAQKCHTAKAKFLLVTLGVEANPIGCVFTTFDRLCDLTELPQPDVVAILFFLEELGFIRRVCARPGGDGVPVYQLALPGVRPRVDEEDAEDYNHA